MMMAAMHEALWWEPGENGRVVCTLCPRNCKIPEGQPGFCFIRANVGGKLRSLAYGRPVAVHVDPIEKKPLFHFLPGSMIFSMGTAGCNLGCMFCQNWSMSKSRSDLDRSGELDPRSVVAGAIQHGCPSIAFTYNEPTIWGEYVIDVAREARAAGLRTVMVTNGYIEKGPLHDIYEHIDAANVDLKAHTEGFYSRVTLSHLGPVLEALVEMRRVMGVWVEVTNLMIPGLNDDPGETARLATWILENLGPDVPLHFTCFHPDFKMTDRPATPRATVARARAIARQAGLRFVYEGNVLSEGNDTFCPSCGCRLIHRSWHNVVENRVLDGRCPDCHEAIPVVTEGGRRDAAAP